MTLIPIDPPLPDDARPLSDGHATGCYYEYTDDGGTKRIGFAHKPTSHLGRRVVACRPVRVDRLTDEEAEACGYHGWYHPCHPDIGETDGRTPYEEAWEDWQRQHPGTVWAWMIETED